MAESLAVRLMSQHESVRRPFQRAALSVALAKEDMGRALATAESKVGPYVEAYAVFYLASSKKWFMYALYFSSTIVMYRRYRSTRTTYSKRHSLRKKTSNFWAPRESKRSIVSNKKHTIFVFGKSSSGQRFELTGEYNKRNFSELERAIYSALKS